MFRVFAPRTRKAREDYSLNSAVPQGVVALVRAESRPRCERSGWRPVRLGPLRDLGLDLVQGAPVVASPRCSLVPQERAGAPFEQGCDAAATSALDVSVRLSGAGQLASLCTALVDVAEPAQLWRWGIMHRRRPTWNLTVGRIVGYAHWLCYAPCRAGGPAETGIREEAHAGNEGRALRTTCGSRAAPAAFAAHVADGGRAVCSRRSPAGARRGSKATEQVLHRERRSDALPERIRSVPPPCAARGRPVGERGRGHPAAILLRCAAPHPPLPWAPGAHRCRSWR